MPGDKPDLALVLDAPKTSARSGKSPFRREASEDEAGLEPAVSEPDIDVSPELETAAGAVRAAFSSKDDVELAKTLKGFLKLCGDY